MKKVTERRLSLDESGIEILNRLLLEPPFKGLSISEMFALCMIQGKKQGFRTPMSKIKGIVRETTLGNSDLRYLMMAIATEEAGNMEVIANKNEYFKICEEYARTGLDFLEAEYVKNSKNLLDNLEFEALEYFDENIE